MEPGQYNYYEKILTKTDIEGKLVLLMHWLDNRLLPVPIRSSTAIPIPFKDGFGDEYTFWLKVRPPKPGKNRNYMKPVVMRRGWNAYVVKKELKVGESIYLWLDDRGHPRIKARDPPRLHRLFGSTFLY